MIFCWKKTTKLLIQIFDCFSFFGKELDQTLLWYAIEQIFAQSRYIFEPLSRSDISKGISTSCRFKLLILWLFAETHKKAENTSNWRILGQSDRLSVSVK